jgi:hypothetical protein
MASIRKEISIAVAPEVLWDAMRDVGALHTRLVAGFVVDCRLEGETRTVTFANGMVAKELMVQGTAAWSGSPTCCRTNWLPPSLA